jgi:hypothetical protein
LLIFANDKNIPVDTQPRLADIFGGRDSGCLSHGHWQLSQLTENVASEPEWKQLELPFWQ